MAIHRPTLFNLMNCIVGVSILAIPFCFHQCGVILGSLTMLTMMFCTKKTCSLLLLSAQLARRRSYESLAYFTYNHSGKLAVEICIIGLMAGTLCAFNVIIGDLGPNILHNVFAIEVTPSIRALVMILLAYGIGFPLSLMRDISSLANLSAVSLMFYASFVAQVIFNSLPHFFSFEWMNTINFWRPEGLLQTLPIFTLAFACQTQLFGLYDTIPDPSIKKMDAVINVGLFMVNCVYLSVGFFSYVTFYDVGVKGDILTNYGNSLLSNCLKLGFMMSVIVSFPLMVFPMRASINSLLFPSQTAGTENMPGGPGYMPQNRFMYITMIIITATLTVGILIPQIEFILGLTGATMGIVISLILPASMYLHVVQETKSEHRTIAKIVLSVGLVCLIASTYSTLTTESHSHEDKPVNKLTPSVVIPTVEHLVTNLKVPSNLSDLKSIKSPPTAMVQVSKDKEDTKEIKADEKKVNEKGVEVEEKRKEPALPHAPREKKEKDAAPVDQDGGAANKANFLVDEKAVKGIDNVEKVADPLNEKRQLMSTDDSKGMEPQKSARTADSSLLGGKPSNENKQNDFINSNQSKNIDRKDIKHDGLKNLGSKIMGERVSKKPGLREKRQDETPTENEKERKTVNEKGNDNLSVTTTPSSPSTDKPNESSSNSSVVIVEPKQTSSPKQLDTTLKPVTESSSLSPVVTNVTGEVVKGRELKSNNVHGRKLHSVNQYNSIWRERLKKHGSLRVKRHSKNKIGLS